MSALLSHPALQKVARCPYVIKNTLTSFPALVLLQL